MYFFDPFDLAHRLRDGTLSEAIRYRLVMMGLFLQGLDSVMGGLVSQASSSPRSFTTFFYWLIILVGVHLAYRTNARGDNRAFIERWVCLSVPLLWWLRALPYTLDLLLYRALFAHYGAGYGAVLRNVAPLMHIWIWGRYICFYIALNVLIRIAASGSPTTEEKLFAPIASP